LHLALKPPQSVFEGFSLLQSDFRQRNTPPNSSQFGLVSYCKISGLSQVNRHWGCFEFSWFSRRRSRLSLETLKLFCHSERASSREESAFFAQLIQREKRYYVHICKQEQNHLRRHEWISFGESRSSWEKADSSGLSARSE
jgi:hypothetical protein